uniref:L1 transposable element RRM domain-containing protein n=1 Tax=Latimeria chalumnae TaxID=7897 RepID=H2ZTB6_LATCH
LVEFFKKTSLLTALGKMGKNSPKQNSSLSDFKSVFSILNKIAADTSNIKIKIIEIDNKLDSVDECFDEMESRISTLEDHEEEKAAKMADIQKKLQKAWDWVEDLENQSRRSNVCLMGLPEVDFLKKNLPVLLDLLEGEDLEIERAQRSLVPKPKTNQRPRPIIMRLLKFRTRELILRRAREKQIVTWENHRLAFFQDLSKEVQQKRKAFMECKRILQDRAVKLAYLVILRIQHEGQWYSFPTPEVAEVFIKYSPLHQKFQMFNL